MDQPRAPRPTGPHLQTGTAGTISGHRASKEITIQGTATMVLTKISEVHGAWFWPYILLLSYRQLLDSFVFPTFDTFLKSVGQTI